MSNKQAGDFGEQKIVDLIAYFNRRKKLRVYEN